MKIKRVTLAVVAVLALAMLGCGESQTDRDEMWREHADRRIAANALAVLYSTPESLERAIEEKLETRAAYKIGEFGYPAWTPEPVWAVGKLLTSAHARGWEIEITVTESTP